MAEVYQFALLLLSGMVLTAVVAVGIEWNFRRHERNAGKRR